MWSCFVLFFMPVVCIHVQFKHLLNKFNMCDDMDGILVSGFFISIRTFSLSLVRVLFVGNINNNNKLLINNYYYYYYFMLAYFFYFTNILLHIYLFINSPEEIIFLYFTIKQILYS
jgi:hypothetical protein